MSAIEEVRDSCTGCVRMWLDNPRFKSSGPDSFAFINNSNDEVRRLVIDAPHDEAADVLERWFTDRLTVDPGVPGPFYSLAFDLLGNVLDLVDWQAIADEIRA
jgi:hypothetical protein